MNVLVQILQGGNLLLAFLAPTLELALKIKGLFHQSPDIAVNISNLEGEAIAADDDTIAVVNAWLKSKGRPELVFPAAQ
jgi:hypothetical protein